MPSSGHFRPGHFRPAFSMVETRNCPWRAVWTNGQSVHAQSRVLIVRRPSDQYFLRSLSAILAAEVFGMKSNSDWQNRLGTIRVAALGVMVIAIGVIWYIRH